MNQVASYKHLTTLETDKKVNLVYGLNGTGKSILSSFLYERTNSEYTNCSIEGLINEEILVYNQRFIDDNFYVSKNLKGIFTLSKENKEAEENIKNAEKEITKLEENKKKYTDTIISLDTELSQKKQNAETKTWEIKTKFTGGDRVLEYCLERLKGEKDKLFSHLLSVVKPVQQPSENTDQLKKEVEAIKGSTAKKYELVHKINLLVQQVESENLFQK